MTWKAKLTTVLAVLAEHGGGGRVAAQAAMTNVSDKPLHRWRFEGVGIRRRCEAIASNPDRIHRVRACWPARNRGPGYRLRLQCGSPWKEFAMQEAVHAIIQFMAVPMPSGRLACVLDVILPQSIVNEGRAPLVGVGSP